MKLLSYLTCIMHNECKLVMMHIEKYAAFNFLYTSIETFPFEPDFHKKSTLLKQNVALLAFDFCSSHSDSLRKTWKYSNATMRKQADERVEATLRSPIRHTCIKILACRFGPFGHSDSFWNRARVLSETVQLYLFAVLLRCPDVS
ncbi:hypothetical protein Tsp_08003 [Trichinella spiralis]|uniref:hypothetical protein n=1 Tax=Trichinella spiralis TaxID=6334 RepID=UPI0001EFDD33|nr:hypothetical protein Tsp_08003 [Trichinella spiralis]